MKTHPHSQKETNSVAVSLHALYRPSGRGWLANLVQSFTGRSWSASDNLGCSRSGSLLLHSGSSSFILKRPSGP
jgi:hypothetical protein